MVRLESGIVACLQGLVFDQGQFFLNNARAAFNKSVSHKTDVLAQKLRDSRVTEPSRDMAFLWGRGKSGVCVC